MSTSPSAAPAGPVGVIGAGIVGLATARLLARADVPVIVFEKESSAGTHQTGHNSGVVHAGIYYKPGSAKATMTRHGVSLLKEYCASRPELPYDERGKLVVARDEAETVKLKELERRSLANGVPGIQWLTAEELRELEPDVAGVAAILSPTTAIVDYPAITRAFGADVTAAGGQVLTSSPVTAVRAAGQDRVEVDTPGGAHVLSRLVICAGLQADLLARQAGDAPAPEIIPFRGEYLRLAPHARDRVRRLIYPVPDPRYPFLGVHLTPRVNGESDLGPNAVLALAREGYRRTDVSAAELARLARSGAFWRLARQHWMTGIREMRGSLIRRAYLAEARTYLPWLTMADVTSAPAGVRAQAVDADGTLVDDFRITRAGPVTAVRNAPSPAATASMAIAEHIVAELAIPGVSVRLGNLSEAFTYQECLELMDEAGVNRVLIVPPSWEGDRTDYAFEACEAHPDRFGIMARVPQNKPAEGGALMREFAQNPYIKGTRLTFHRPQDRNWMIEGTCDWYWPLAEELGLVTMVHAPSWKAELGAIAARHPGLKIIIDHMGIMAVLRAGARVSPGRLPDATTAVLQGFGLVSLLTAAENVEIGLRAAGLSPRAAMEAAAEALTELGLGEHVDHLVQELSGGQQQRVAVARVLASRPGLLIADEPTAEQDAVTRELVLARMFAVASDGGAIVLATHDPEVASRCDRVISLARHLPTHA